MEVGRDFDIKIPYTREEIDRLQGETAKAFKFINISGSAAALALIAIQVIPLILKELGIIELPTLSASLVMAGFAVVAILFVGLIFEYQNARDRYALVQDLGYEEAKALLEINSNCPECAEYCHAVNRQGRELKVFEYHCLKKFARKAAMKRAMTVQAQIN